MRDFSWKYFTLTGDVESFLLYKEINDSGTQDGVQEWNALEDEWAAEGEEQ